MIVGVFKHKVNPKFKEEFNNLYGHAQKYVSMIDGYISHEVFTGENGHNMLVVYFRDKESCVNRQQKVD